MVADCSNILDRWWNHFSQLLINDDNQTEIYTAQPLVPEPSVFEVELAIDVLKSKKSGIDQIPSELIKTGCRTICYHIHKLIISICNKEELPEQWKQSITVPIYRKGNKTDCSDYTAISH